MKISVAGIYDRGNLDKERVHFRADTDLDLSYFVLLDTMWINDTQVAAGSHGAFWFAPQQIPRGHHVVVYTRVGTPNVETRDDGSVYHFVFRGLGYPQYVSPQATVVFIEALKWLAIPTQPGQLPPLPSIAGPLLGSLFTYGTPTVGDLTAAGAGGARLGDLLNPKR
jgi:hypothetical protein